MPLLPEIAACETIPKALGTAAGILADNTCQLYKNETRTPGKFNNSRTLKDFHTLVQHVACGLIEEGIESGSSICILSENRPEWNIFDHGVMTNGCTTVGVYTNDSMELVKFKLNDTGAAAILVEDKKQLDKLISIPPGEIPTLKNIYLLDPAGVTLENKNISLFSDLLKKGAEAGVSVLQQLDKRIDSVDAGMTARLVYTSGTSGTPKGVMLSHRNLMSNVAGSIEGADMYENDTLISYMPEAHIFQAIFSLGVLLLGACQAYSFRKTLIADLPEIRPTLFPGVQRVWAKVHDGIDAKTSSGIPGFLRAVAPRFLARTIKKKAGLDRVRRFYSGASKLEPYTFNFFKDFFGDEILLGYGISETIVNTMNTVEGQRFGSSGKAVPGVTIKIVGENRKSLTAGERGEVAVKGPNVFEGYLNREDKYREVVDEEGWFYTGDRGYLDEDGYLFVLGRAGFRVKFSDGEYHDLEAIGAKLLEHTKLISQIAVYGEGKDYPVAIVSMSDEEDDLRRMANDLGVKYTGREMIAYEKKIVVACGKDFERACRKLAEDRSVSAMEQIRKALYIRPMSEDNAEKTPTAKTRLNYILSKYEKDISALYESEDSFVLKKIP